METIFIEKRVWNLSQKMKKYCRPHFSRKTRSNSLLKMIWNKWSISTGEENCFLPFPRFTRELSPKEIMLTTPISIPKKGLMKIIMGNFVRLSLPSWDTENYELNENFKSYLHRAAPPLCDTLNYELNKKFRAILSD